MEEENTKLALLELAQQAREQPQILKCCPNELRDLAVGLRPNRAGGQDGLGTNMLRLLPFQAFIYLAGHFEKIANSGALDLDHRPQAWSISLVVLLSKTPLADSPSQFRPIALLAQLKKLYTRWVMLFLQQDFEAAQVSTQYGFRRARQASEVSHTILRMKEKAFEWHQNWSFYKIDVAKAFDSVSHSRVIDALRETCSNKVAALAIAKELIGGYLSLHFFGLQTSPLNQTQGVKQGAPESGPLFNLALSHLLKPLQSKWKAERKGLRLTATEKLTSLLFADDIVLCASSVAQAVEMMQELRGTLLPLGLQFNMQKLQILASGPIPEQTPGKNVNKEGMEILGRWIERGEGTDLDIEKKLGKALRKYMSFKMVLRQPTALAHRLKLLRSVVLSVALWGAESWIPTKRRMSRLRGFHLSLLRSIILRPSASPRGHGAPKNLT